MNIIKTTSLFAQVLAITLLVRFTHMLQEDTKLWVGVRVNCSLENREEDVFQHLSEVWHKVPASENVAKG